MSTITLVASRSWLTDPTNPTGPAVSFGTTRSSPVAAAMAGDFRVYAGDRIKVEVQEESAITIPMTLRHLSYSGLLQLLQWRGTTLLLRTWLGERFYVAYLEVDYTLLAHTTPDDDDLWNDTTFDAQVTFRQVSWTEGV